MGDPEGAHSRGAAGLGTQGIGLGVHARPPSLGVLKVLGETPHVSSSSRVEAPPRQGWRLAAWLGGRGGTLSVLWCLETPNRAPPPPPSPHEWTKLGSVWGLAGEAGCVAGLGTQLAEARRFAGSPAQGEGESGPESGKWSFLARIEREGRALGLHQYLVRNPCPFGLLGWAGTEKGGGSVASGTGWDRVGAEARMEGGRWDRLAEQGCTCVSFIGGGVLRSTCL